jgi:hypothetical protein
MRRHRHDGADGDDAGAADAGDDDAVGMIGERQARCRQRRPAGRLGDAEKDQLIGFVRAESATSESPAPREFLRDFADAILATTS